MNRSPTAIINVKLIKRNNKDNKKVVQAAEKGYIK